jgi:hypothetical protein
MVQVVFHNFWIDIGFSVQKAKEYRDEHIAIKFSFVFVTIVFRIG